MIFSRPQTLLLSAAALAAIVFLSPNAVAERAVPIPPPSAEVLRGVATASQPTARAVFAGGCFWHVEDDFRHVRGVVATTAGYSGGTLKSPTYDDMHSGKTGHAETVEVQYDPKLVTYDQLLDVFFKKVDPTTLDRQGPDVGNQYRSILFYGNDREKTAAMTKIKALEAKKIFPLRIVTEVTPASKFWRAEEYHQHYFEKNGMSHY